MTRFGLIGYPLTHSFSQKYFTEKFQREGIDAVYEKFPIPSIDQLPLVLKKHTDLAGLNVTIPHKENVLSYVNERSDVVKKIGACNCISIRNGKLAGHNTDVIGFRDSLQQIISTIPAKALILGTGGAAKAVEFVLKQMKIPYRFVSRKPSANALSYEQLTPRTINEAKLIINTTPLGMHPQIVEAPPIPYDGIDSLHILYDVIYNPEKTLFLQKGESRGATIKNGLEMLLIQAEESWKVWNA